MSLKIRLSRIGARKRPVYRIVVADSRHRAMGGSWSASAFISRCCRPTTPSGWP